MSETPSPCWVSFLAPYFSPEKAAWIAAVIWRETLTDREVLGESGAFEAYRHALQASRFLAASRDRSLRNAGEDKPAGHREIGWGRGTPEVRLEHAPG
jgi:hypothetical protein